jgi:Ca-activated chloride channel family protein
MVHWFPTRRDSGVKLFLAAAVGVSLSLSVSSTSAAQAPAAGPGPGGASPAAQLTILSPEEDSYISGETTLRANLDPPDAASAVIFFIDGRQKCVVPTAPFECAWDAGRAITEHQIRVVATLTAGGRVVKTLRTKGVIFNDNEDVDAVQVTVTVMDGPNRYVRGLPVSAFKVFENGQPQKISYFANTNVPLELIAAVDVSASMGPVMPKLKRAVQEFLGAVPAGEQVTLLGFNDTVFTLAYRATKPSDRIKAVDRLAPWGSTALYDLILRSIGMLGRQTGRKVLVVFTDGEDQGSHATISDVERGLQGSDVTLYMIGQGRGVTQDRLKAVMERLSKPTGGRALFSENIDTLRGTFAELLDELSNQYLLGYAPPGARQGEAWRSIKVEVDGHSDIRARQGYRPTAGK